MPQNMALIREGIKKVPVLKYAFGLSVIAACLQLAVGIVGGNTKLLVLGVPATMAVMILLFLLARLVAIKASVILLPLQVLIWSVTTAFVIVVAASLSALIFGHPATLYRFMFPVQPTLSEEKSPLHPNQPARKVLTQMYEQAGKEKMTTGPFAGQAPFIETFRDDAVIITGEKVWFRSKQMNPTEIVCPTGPSAGFACSLDANGRLEAYIRQNCGIAPITGKKVFSGCSFAMPIFDPAHPVAPTVQCCFYEDSPAARGLQYGHSLAEWISSENANK